MKSTTKRLTEKQKETIIKLYKQGLKILDIPEKAGCTEGQVRQVIYIENDFKRKTRQLTKAEVQVVLTFHKMGMSKEEIADHFGVSKYQIRYSLKRFGIRLPYRITSKRKPAVKECDKEKMGRLYMQGLTNEEISNETGYTYNQVCRVIYKEMDMERKNKSWTLFDIQEIKKLYKDGNSLEEIADIFGKSRATVSYVLSYNGIKARDLRKDGDV